MHAHGCGAPRLWLAKREKALSLQSVVASIEWHISPTAHARAAADGRRGRQTMVGKWALCADTQAGTKRQLVDRTAERRLASPCLKSELASWGGAGSKPLPK